MMLTFFYIDTLIITWIWIECYEYKLLCFSFDFRRNLRCDHPKLGYVLYAPCHPFNRRSVYRLNDIHYPPLSTIYIKKKTIQFNRSNLVIARDPTFNLFYHYQKKLSSFDWTRLSEAHVVTALQKKMRSWTCQYNKYMFWLTTEVHASKNHYWWSAWDTLLSKLLLKLLYHQRLFQCLLYTKWPLIECNYASFHKWVISICITKT